jgi:hypothetical protein
MLPLVLIRPWFSAPFLISLWLEKLFFLCLSSLVCSDTSTSKFLGGWCPFVNSWRDKSPCIVTRSCANWGTRRDTSLDKGEKPLLWILTSNFLGASSGRGITAFPRLPCARVCTRTTADALLPEKMQEVSLVTDWPYLAAWRPYCTLGCQAARDENLSCSSLSFSSVDDVRYESARKNIKNTKRKINEWNCHFAHGTAG